MTARGPETLTGDARRLYWQGHADGRTEGEARRAGLDFWRGFICGGALVVAWMAGALLFLK